MNLISSFVSSVYYFIQNVNNYVSFHACDVDLALPMSLGIFDPSHEIPLASKDILLEEDEIIDTFLNITLPSIHSNALSFGNDAILNDKSPLCSNALSSRDVALVNDKSHLCFDPLSSRDDALGNDEPPSTSDPPWTDVENMSSNEYSTSCDDSVNVIYVSSAPQMPKRQVIYLTLAIPPKRIFSINSVPSGSDSSDLSMAPSYRVVSHTYENRMDKQPSLPQAPKSTTKSPGDYDLVEQIRVTLTKISLWDLLQSVLIYQGML